MACAVPGWSPVIITGVMPALRQSATACAASGRGGSIRAARPSRVSRSFRLRRGLGQGGEPALGQGQHAVALAGEGLGLVQQGVAGQGFGAAGPEPVAATRQQHLGGALDQGQHAVVVPVQSGHQLAFAVERDFGQAGQVGFQRGLVQAGRGGRLVQGQLGRLAGGPAVVKRHVVAQGQGPAELVPGGGAQARGQRLSRLIGGQ